MGGLGIKSGFKIINHKHYYTAEKREIRKDSSPLSGVTEVVKGADSHPESPHVFYQTSQPGRSTDAASRRFSPHPCPQGLPARNRVGGQATGPVWGALWRMYSKGKIGPFGLAGEKRYMRNITGENKRVSVVPSFHRFLLCGLPTHHLTT